MSPLRRCGYNGCTALKRGNGYCDRCESKRHEVKDASRPDPVARGYDKTWQRLRTEHLRRQPACVECLETEHLHVDHIIAFDGPNDPLRLDPRNLQTLCRRHHARKTIKHDGAFGRTKLQ